jgi:hypothetical protein
MRPEQASVRHWQLVLLASTFSLLVGALPEGAATPLDAVPYDADTPASVSAGGKIRTNQHSSARRGTRRVERDAASGAGVVVPLGAAAAVLEALVDRRPTARTGRAPCPRRALPPA